MLAHKLYGLYACAVLTTIFAIPPALADTQKRPNTREFTHQIRTGNGLCSAELKTMYKRLPKVKAAAEQLTGTKLSNSQIPLISLVCSGGGYRAMISSLGFFRGLEKIGVLDTTMHAATCSGSTWLLASWLAQNYSLNNLKTFLKNQVRTDLFSYPCDIEKVAGVIASKIFNGQPISLCDIWGGILGTVLFEGLASKDQDIYLSQLAAKINTGNFPIPLFSAALESASRASKSRKSKSRDTSNPYAWCEFSPYEVGSDYLNAWVPAADFGKYFEDGSSTDQAAEQTLGYLCGMWGSAYAASFQEALAEVERQIQNLIIGKNKSTAKMRFSPPQVFNFTQNMSSSPCADQELLTIVDGGFLCNLPVGPVLRRPCDVIIILDASDNVATSAEIKKVEAYAKKNRLNFPKVNYQTLATAPVTVLSDDNNPEAPIIIYFPNQVPMSTLKFQFSEREFDSVYNYMENAVVQNKDLIVSAIKKSISQNRARVKNV